MRLNIFKQHKERVEALFREEEAKRQKAKNQSSRQAAVANRPNRAKGLQIGKEALRD